MTITVNIGDADLSELLAKVEAGEDVILARGDTPVARLVAASVVNPAPGAEAQEFTDEERERRRILVETILAERQGRSTATAEEIIEWKNEGHR